MNNQYDVIITGARCAGAATAMLLARRGYKVLLLDKAVFPSDTISTHIILPGGVSRLKQWGLLEKIMQTGAPLITRMRFDVGAFAIQGSPPLPAGISGFIAPRRKYLDKILVDAAVEAGAELRENCHVEEILMNNGTVIGVKCRTKGGESVSEYGRMVIGADGRNSLVAKSTHAEAYIHLPSLTAWYYTYWSGVPADELAFYARPDMAIGTIPTNNGLTCMPIAMKAEKFHSFRADFENNYEKTIRTDPVLGELVRNGKIEERILGMTDLPGFFRKSFGPGWALAGDAGYHRDPFTGQGISDAFRSADVLSEAIDAGFSERTSLEDALLHYQQSRDEEVMPMFGLTCEWAKLDPPTPEQEALFNALRTNPIEAGRFFGTLAGTVSIPEFFNPGNLARIVGAGEVVESE